MNSADWKNKRAEYIASKEHSNDCYGCGKRYKSGFHLHHVTYQRLGAERLSDLVMVCRLCHESIHEAYKFIKPLDVATDTIRAANGLPVAPRPVKHRPPRGIVKLSK
jgi:hypothetical protein